MNRFFLRGLATMALAAVLMASAPEANAAHIDVTFISQTKDALIQRNDFYRARFTVGNNGASGNDQLGRVFYSVQVPTGGVVNHTVENEIFQIGEVKEYRVKDFIPANAPAGTYTVTVGLAYGMGLTETKQMTFTLGAPAPPATALSAPTSTTALTLAAPQAGPNPFSAATTIRYELGQEAEVSLGVYDLRGRQVASLVNGTQSAGAQSAVFSGDNLPSGVYMWRLAVDGQVQTGRVSLVR